MEFLVGLIIEAIGCIWEEAVNSPRVPKIVRTVLVLLFGIPVSGLIWLLAVIIFREHRPLAGAAVSAVALFFTALFALLIRRIWTKV